MFMIFHEYFAKSALMGVNENVVQRFWFALVDCYGKCCVEFQSIVVVRSIFDFGDRTVYNISKALIY